MNEAEVIFQPEGRRIDVPEGILLSDAAARAGIPIGLPCGGQGACGKCRVRITDHIPEPTPADKQAFTEKECRQGFRLACQTPVHGPMTVEIPATSRVAAETQILEVAHNGSELSFTLDSPVSKRHFELAPPSLESDSPDLERLTEVLGEFRIDVAMLRLLPTWLRSHDFRGTAVLVDGRLVGLEEGDTQSVCYGLAFDIGTTTLVGVLTDLCTGRPAGSTSRINPQTQYGDDVISRIQRVRERPSGLDDLHGCLIETLNEMIAQLCRDAAIKPCHIYEAVFSGNTTMLHCLAAVSPAALGEIPFVAAMRRSVSFLAEDIDLAIAPQAAVCILPSVGGFVGGDTVAGMLVTEIAEAEHPTMLIDIGTNGEIVVKSDGRLVAASCAAGPGLEGANITHGMRAMRGAIERIILNDDVHYEVIGDAPPAGLCGSAIIDAIAELLRHGIVMPEGLFLTGEHLPDHLPEALRNRIVEGEDGPEFVVAEPQASATGEAITITHRDIRAIQLAIAAARSAVAILLRRLDLSPGQLDRVFVAGAFGNYIRIRNAQRIGLLTTELDESRFTFVGNSSLEGARRLVLSKSARANANRLAHATEHVELSTDPQFQMEYIEAMCFPREDALAVEAP